MNYSGLKMVDIADLVGRWVILKRRGPNYVGLCPFHAEKTPSFSVSPSKGFFYCFGCGATGDALEFVHRLQGGSIAEAANYLSKEYDIPLNKENDPHEKLRGQLSSLALQFENNVDPALPYLASRGITTQMVKHWRIGYASGVYDQPFLREAGLLSEGGRFLLNGRLIFPIMDSHGRIISMAGRIIPGRDGPKYINGQNSQLYDKSTTLYGLNRATRAIKEAGYAVLVEGYTDVILLHGAGHAATVAACGTGITEGHLATLSTLCGEIVIATDPDDAGIKAALRTIRMAPQYNLSTRVKILQEDPADAVAHGTYEESPQVPGMIFYKQHSASENDAVVMELLEIISGYKNYVKKDLEVKNISNIFAIPIRELSAELKLIAMKKIKNQKRLGQWAR